MTISPESSLSNDDIMLFCYSWILTVIAGTTADFLLKIVRKRRLDWPTTVESFYSSMIAEVVLMLILTIGRVRWISMSPWQSPSKIP